MDNYPKIALRGLEGVIFIHQEEILYANALGNYSEIILTDNRTVKILKKLKQVSQLLSQDSFTRIHRSHLINLKHLKEYHEQEFVVMSDGTSLPVSRACKGEFFQRFIRL